MALQIVTHRACRTIRDQDQNEIKGSSHLCTKSSDQGHFKWLIEE